LFFSGLDVDWLKTWISNEPLFFLESEREVKP